MSDDRLEELCQTAQGLLNQGQTAEAAPLFQQIIEHNADFAAAHEGLALACSMEANWDAAEKHFAKLIQLQPTLARHYVNLGTMYNRKGDYQKAVDALRRALQRDRKSAQGYFNLGLAYRKLKQTPMAVSAYKESIKLSPEFAEAYLNLANVYMDMSNLQQAIQMFKKAIELRPTLEKAKRGLEKAQAAFTQAKQAESPFGRLVDTDTRAKSVPTMERELTDEERIKDREMIRELMDELNRLGKECQMHLEDVMEPKLHELHRMITSNELDAALTRTSQEFREALDRWNNLRQQLRRKVQELRAHEELLSTPEIRLD